MNPPRVYRGKRFRPEPVTSLGRANEIAMKRFYRQHRNYKFLRLFDRIFPLGPFEAGYTQSVVPPSLHPLPTDHAELVWWRAQL